MDTKKLHKALLFAVFSICIITIDAQTPGMQWAGRFTGATASNTKFKVATDDQGFIYVAGKYEGSTDFDIVGDYSATYYPAMFRSLLLKFSPRGEFIQYIQIANDQSEITDIKIRNGFIYITGIFSSINNDFDPGASQLQYDASGTCDIFFGKYDLNFSPLWVKKIGNSGTEISSTIEVDLSGNVYLAGSFSQSFYSFPDNTNFLTNFGDGYTDFFIAKYDDNGNGIWGKAIGGTGNDRANIAMDNNSNIYLSGIFGENNTGIVTNFNPDGTANLTNSLHHTNFLAKFNSSGTFQWANKLGGIEGKVNIGTLNEVYVYGAYNGYITPANFNPSGTDTLRCTINQNRGFIAEYNNNGVFSWVQLFGTDDSNADYVSCVKFINNNSIGALVYHGTGLIEYKSLNPINGSDLNSFSIGSATFANYLHIDKGSNIIISGATSSTSDFDPSAYMHSVGSGSFLAKYFQTPSIQESNLKALMVRDTLVTLNWQRGSADSVIVFAAQLTTGAPSISNNINYNSNSRFGFGSLISTWRCVYKGTDNKAVVTNLSSNSNYRFYVAGFNSNGTTILYNNAISPGDTLNIQMTSEQRALMLNGTNQCIEGAENTIADFGNGNFTAEAWIKTNSTASTEQVILSNRYAAADGNYFTLYLMNSKIGVNINGNAIGRITLNGKREVVDGNWHHVALVRIGNVARLYIDGQQDGNLISEDAAVANVSNGSGFNIGARNAGTSSLNFYFPGTIDEVRLWNKAFTDNEIKASIYNRPNAGNVANLVLDYQFNQTVADSVFNKKTSVKSPFRNSPSLIASTALLTPFLTNPIDVTPGGFRISWCRVPGIVSYALEYASNSSFSGATQIPLPGDTTFYIASAQGAEMHYRVKSNMPLQSDWSEGKILAPMFLPGNALAFDGNNKQVYINSLTSLSDQHTFEAWIKPNSIAGQQKIFDKGGELEISLYNGNIAYTTNSGSGWNAFIVSNRILSINEWSHLAIIKDADSLAIFINGRLDKKVQYQFAKTNGASIVTLSGTSIYSLNAIIDEVRIWNMPRSMQQIKNNMHKALDPMSPGLLLYYNFDHLPGATMMPDLSPNGFHGTLVNMSGTSEWVTSGAVVKPFIQFSSGLKENTFSIHWDKIFDATNYFVELYKDSLFTQYLYSTNTSDTTIQFISGVNGYNLYPDSNYFCRVYSVGSWGSSSWATFKQKAPNFRVTSVSVNNVSCSGSSNGSITVNVAGGLPPYTYTLNTDNLVQSGINAPNYTFNNIIDNTGYYVVVVDSKGDTAGIQDIIVGAPLFNVAINGLAGNICENNTYTLTANITGGAAPYIFNWWTNNGVLINNGSTAQYTSESDGSNTITLNVTDNTGCQTNDMFEGFVLSKPNANLGPDSLVKGNTIQLSVPYYSGFTFEWTKLTGTGGSFNNSTIDNVIFTGIEGNTYKIRCNVNSAACGSASDTIQISFIHDNMLDSLQMHFLFANNDMLEKTGHYTGPVMNNTNTNYGRTGIWGTMSLQGNGYLVHYDAKGVASDSFSLSVWVKPMQIDKEQVIVSADSSFKLKIGADNKVKGDIWKGTSWGTISSVNTIKKGMWQHIVWQRSKTGVQNLWIDNNFEIQNTETTKLKTPNIGTVIGAYVDTAGLYKKYFSGMLEELRIYRRFLKPIEISELYINPQFISFNKYSDTIGGLANSKDTLIINSNGSWTITQNPHWATFAPMSGTGNGSIFITAHEHWGDFMRGNSPSEEIILNGKYPGYQLKQQTVLKTGLVAWWPFDWGTSDMSGNFYNAMQQGSTFNFVNDRFGINGNAIQFNGTDNYLTVPSAVYFNSDFTISAWVNIANHNQWQSLIDFGNGATSDNVIFGLSYETSGQPCFKVLNGSSESWLNTSVPMTLSEWKLVTLTKESNKFNFYINGIKKDSTTGTANASRSATIFNPNSILRTSNRIGFSNSSTGSPLPFNGIMDDMRIYKRPLSPKEISEMYCPSPNKPYLGSDMTIILNTSASIDSVMMVMPPNGRKWYLAGNSPNTDIILPNPMESIPNFMNATIGHTYIVVCKDTNACGKWSADTIIMNFTDGKSINIVQDVINVQEKWPVSFTVNKSPSNMAIEVFSKQDSIAMVDSTYTAWGVREGMVYAIVSEKTSGFPRDSVLINVIDTLPNTFWYQGNKYHTVKIGNRTWFKENLESEKYNDGSTIASGIYNWDNIWQNSMIMGKHYTWNVVNSGKICPVGWHVPSVMDWQELEYTVGSNVGQKLKAKGKVSDNTGYCIVGGGTDQYQFTWFPFGTRDSLGNYNGLYNFSSFWTSDQMDANRAFGAVMHDATNSFVPNSYYSKNMAMSVRCIKDSCLKPVSYAGPDTILLTTNYMNLRGIAPFIPRNERGKWNIISGTGGIINNDTLHNSLFTGQFGQIYKLIWKMYNVCDTISDTVQISINCIPPTIVTQPQNQNICSGQSANFAVSANGTSLQYQWKKGISNITLATLATYTRSNISSVDSGKYSVMITNTCGSVESNVVQLNLVIVPTANAGSDQLNLIGTQVTLSAINPGGTSKYWYNLDSIAHPGLFANRTIENTQFTGQMGITYRLLWKIAASCGIAKDTVIVSFTCQQPISQAGPDTTIVSGVTTLNLKGIKPLAVRQEKGQWHIVSGTGGTFANDTTFNTAFTGQLGQNYKLRWRMYNVCGEANDTVQVSFICQAPSIIQQPQSIVRCAADSAQFGIVASGTLLNYQWHKDSTNIGGAIQNSYKFGDISSKAGNYRVKISNGCGTIFSNVATLSLQQIPTANAGSDQLNVTTPNAILAANFPGGVVKYWKNIDSATNGGNFANPSIENTLFNGIMGKSYRLVWHLQNTCGLSKDTVKIHFACTTPIANAGSDRLNIPDTFVMLQATLNYGKGKWSKASGNGGLFENDTISNSNFIGIRGQSYKLVWSVTNPCATIRDTLFIHFAEPINCIVPSFAYNVIAQSVTFLNKTPIGSWITSWDFGDGMITYEKNPVHDFGKEGTYPVKLILVDTVNKCNTDTIKWITIGPKPECAAIFELIKNDSSRTIEVFDMSQGAIAKWIWSFGDGSSANGQLQAPHVYAAKGTYDLSLTVIDSTGTCSNQWSQFIDVGIIECKAMFSSILDTAKRSIVFKNLSQGTNDYYWSFGDLKTSDQSEPSHIYSKAGYYEVCLYAVDTTNGCFAEQCNNLFIPSAIIDTATYAKFIWYQDGDTVFFKNQSSANIDKYYWTLGNGNISTLLNPKIKYAKGGIYPVTLTVYDIQTGKNAKYTLPVIVEFGVEICTAEAEFGFMVDDSNKKLTLTNQSKGNFKYVYWTFGDGTSSNQLNPVKSYKNAGYYLVTLTIRDSMGNCSDNTAEFIEVGETGCRADFSYMIDVQNNPAKPKLTVTSNSIGDNLTYFWNMGDGNYTTLKDTTHTYMQPGMYEVSLTISNKATGCFDNYIQEIQVGEISCNAEYSYYVDSFSNKVSFAESNTGIASAMIWSFGDGKYSSTSKPVHQYMKPGYYNVSLSTYEINSGCFDFYEVVILVGNEGSDCEADFIYQSSATGNSVSFIDKSKGQIKKRLWSFGDGQTDTSANPIHLYTKSGYFNVCLTVVNTSGVSNISCQPVVVNIAAAKCLADFNYTIDEVQKKATLNDASMGNPDRWAWDYNNGAWKATTKDVSFTAPTAGYYLVGLKVNNGTLCSDKTYKLLTVGILSTDSTNLKAAFGKDQLAYSQKAGGYPVDFIGTGIGDHAKLRWDFGDETSDTTSSSQEHIYALPGTYQVCYTVSDPVTGATNKACDTVQIKGVCGNELDKPTAVCKNISVKLNIQGSATITAKDIDNGSNDACGSITLSADKTSFTKANLGVNNVKLTVTDGSGNKAECTSQVAVEDYTGISDASCIASINTYPNPFNDEINVELSLLESTFVSIRLMSLQGKEVKKVIAGNLGSGKNYIKITTQNIAAGSYLLQITSGKGVVTTRLVTKD